MVPALCLLPSAFLYLHALDRSPVYLGLDEAHFAVHARAIADTGRDLNGDPWPLFVNLADPLGDQPTLEWGASWYQPLLFYAIALALKVMPFSEATIRTPTALIAGVLDVVLMYAVSMRLFRRRWIAVAAAAMLALTPAHLVLGRQALDYICPLPFQLAWLWLLLVFRDTPRPVYAFAAGLVLGVGCYSYVSSWVMMPAFLAMSFLVYRRSEAASRAMAAAACGFAIPLLPLVPWLWWHPQMVSNLLDAQSMSTIEAFGRGQPLARVVQEMLATYWSYLNPAFLFLNGGPSLNAATQRAGVFLLSIAWLVPVGVWAIFRHPASLDFARDSPEQGRRASGSRQPQFRDGLWWVLLIGLLLAPIPPTLKGMPHVVQRTLTLLPFVVLIAAYGVTALWQSPSRLSRAAAVVLLAAMPLQFASFYRDYLTDYRLRSASAYDRTAFAETARVLIASESSAGVPAFYLTAPLYDVSAKWRFYATKAGRVDLLLRTRYFDGRIEQLHDAQPGSLAVIPVDLARAQTGEANGAWSIDRIVTDVAGNETLAVLRRR